MEKELVGKIQCSGPTPGVLNQEVLVEALEEQLAATRCRSSPEEPQTGSINRNVLSRSSGLQESEEVVATHLSSKLHIHRQGSTQGST